jgi:hypothetical protein
MGAFHSDVVYCKLCRCPGHREKFNSDTKDNTTSPLTEAGA